VETELRNYLEKELGFLNTQESKDEEKTDQELLNKWASRNEFTVKLERNEIVATKKEADLNAECGASCASLPS